MQIQTNNCSKKNCIAKFQTIINLNLAALNSEQKAFTFCYIFSVGVGVIQ